MKNEGSEREKEVRAAEQLAATKAAIETAKGVHELAGEVKRLTAEIGRSEQARGLELKQIATALGGIEAAPDKEQRETLRALDLLSRSTYGPGDPFNPLQDYDYSRPTLYHRPIPHQQKP